MVYGRPSRHPIFLQVVVIAQYSKGVMHTSYSVLVDHLNRVTVSAIFVSTVGSVANFTNDALTNTLIFQE